MRSTRMPDIFHRTAEDLQTAIQHFTLHKTCPPVVFPVKNDQGRADLLYIIYRGLPLENASCPGLPGISAEVFRDQDPGIAFPENSSEIIYASLCTSPVKAGVMPYNPCNQVACVLPSADQ